MKNQRLENHHNSWVSRACSHWLIALCALTSLVPAFDAGAGPKQPPTITSQPQSLVVVAGDPASFSVTATGTTPLYYQWRKNGAAIFGATARILSLTTVTANDAASYNVVVNNAYGTVTSSTATLTVYVPPWFTVQPTSLEVTAGDSAVFVAEAQGIPTPALQWYFGASPLPGEVSSMLILSDVQPSQAGSYYCVAANAAGSANSAAAALTVLVPPEITEQPQTLTVTNGNPASFSVIATGTSPLAYQWRKNGANLPGATDAIFTLGVATTNDAASYDVVVTNVAGTATSAVATLTVYVPPWFTVQPANAVVTPGGNAVFTANAAGIPTPVLQWFFGANLLRGEVSSTLSLTDVQASQAGSYFCAASNAVGSATSAVATLTVNSLPTITTQPQNRTNVAGTAATFAAAASGTTPLTYQWRLNGLSLVNDGRTSGATTATLQIAGVQPGDAGSYTLVVSNAFGVVTSAVAALTVTLPPAVIVPPASRSVVAGASVSFSVTASGTLPLSYQWRFNGADIGGATGASLQLGNVQASNAGSYTVVVTNIAGSVTSAVGVLTVLEPPVIGAQPANLAVTAGASASFSTAASGTEPLSCQWQFNGTKLTNGGQFSGVTGPTLTISDVQPANAGNYTVVITNVAGSIVSEPANLTVVLPGACVSASDGLVGWWPGDGDANDVAGANNGTLLGGATANAAGFVGLAFNFDGTNSYVQIPDAPALKPTNLTIEAWVRFDSLDSAGSAPAGEQYIVFKQNSRSGDFEGYDLRKTRVTGSNRFAFRVASSGGTAAEVVSTTLVTTGVWYHVAAVRGSNFLQVYVNGQLEAQAGVNFDQDYGTTPLYLGTSGQSYWDRKFSGILDEVSLYSRVFSSNEVAAIYAAGAGGKCKGAGIAVQPQSQAVMVGSNADFTVGATGFGVLSYQWRYNGGSIAGATRTRLALTNVQPTDAGSYTVVVTNGLGATTSTVAVLMVWVPPVITAQPTSLSVTAGMGASFSVAALGAPPPGYQWQFNGLAIAGATSPNLFLTDVQPANAGSYTVVVTNSAGSVTSAVAVLTVWMPPVITAQPTSLNVTAGMDASFSVAALGAPPPGYQWQFNGLAIAGATSTDLFLTNVQPANAGSYTVVVTNSAGSVTSAVANLTVVPPFQPGAQNAGTVVLVNSQSANYLDFQHFIKPYLDNFGFPYTVEDISTNAPGPTLTNYAVIIIGHCQVDTNHTYLNDAAQANLSLAVSNGTGLVNFDNDLASADLPRYQFVQDIFGFGYSSGASGTSARLPPTEPSSQMHYITARHPTNDTIDFRSSLSLPGITAPAWVTTLATTADKPLVAVAQYGQGRAVQWGSYDWMVSTVLGPVDGLDDVVWRGVVWAARKPIVMRGLPHFVTMRVDDASGPFDWVHAANAVGFKPFLGLFYSLVSEASAADLQALTSDGKATAGIHSTDADNSFFYFNHAMEQPWPDNVQSNNFYLGTQWHQSHGIPMSKVCATHYSEIGLNCFAGLKAWGIEFVPLEVVPETIEYTTPGAPWVMSGPYRLYEDPQPGQVSWPTYYADWLTVPGHPEFDGQFFNVYSEVRDVSSCGEWCPNNDVAGSIDGATGIAKRAFDSMVMATIFGHEQAISPIDAGNWQAILEGITNNLAAYNPIYVTLDYASQYVRATRTSRLVSCAYDPGLGQVTASFTGKTDLDTGVYVFFGADSAISSTFGTVPAFPTASTNPVVVYGPPAILSAPASRTNNVGTTAVFNVGVRGASPLNYQWYRNGTDALSDGGEVSGAGTAILTVSNVLVEDAGSYSVVVSNLVGSVISPAAILTVVNYPVLLNARMTTNGSFGFTLRGKPGLPYLIEVTTNLQEWTPLAWLTNLTGQVDFTHAASSNSLSQFYRARSSY